MDSCGVFEEFPYINRVSHYINEVVPDFFSKSVSWVRTKTAFIAYLQDPVFKVQTSQQNKNTSKENMRDALRVYPRQHTSE